MQPWDEGLYATRVLSIHINGDFWNQSEHAVGKFYSASHPPLLIWVGYIFTLIFGMNAVSLKLIPFIASLVCILLLMLIGKKLDNLRSGVFAALIFSSTIIFNVFSKRYQFDIPFVMLVLFSFYFFLNYISSGKKSKLIFLGIIFGLSLMIKILVGFFIPIVIFLYYLLDKKRINFTFKDFLLFISIGIIIALPWHIYMILVYGKEFIDYFFSYHILDRALVGVEHNEKHSGPLYYFNYFLSILPYGIILFSGLLSDFKNYRNLSSQKIFLYVWFFTGLIIISAFKTKLEAYTFFIIVPSSLIIPSAINYIGQYSKKIKYIFSFLLILNIIWFLSYPDREHYKNVIVENISSAGLLFITIIIVSILLFVYIIHKINYSNFIYGFIVIYFFIINTFYFYKMTEWENNYHISECKTLIDISNKKKLIYVGTNYRYNAQFSFYFKGVDLGWKNNEYTYTLLDTKNGIVKIKEQLDSSINDYSTIIVEGDNINRNNLVNSALLIPDKFELKLKTNGYEIFQKR